MPIVCYGRQNSINWFIFWRYSNEPWVHITTASSWWRHHLHVYFICFHAKTTELASATRAIASHIIHVLRENLKQNGLTRTSDPGARFERHRTESERARIGFVMEHTSSGPKPPRTSSPSLAASHAHPMYNTRSIFETSRCNNCNIQKKTDETLKISIWNIWKNA
jgi:hypothetical protein